MQMTTLMAESKEELKSLLMKVKEENEKAGLKLNIQKMKIMASGPITSWQIDGETMETVTDFIFLGSKITADGNCSCLENPMDRGAWWATVHGVAKSWTQRSTFHLHKLPQPQSSRVRVQNQAL